MSKEKILATIRQQNIRQDKLPSMPSFPGFGQDTAEVFVRNSAGNGSRVVYASEFENISQAVQVLYPEAATKVSAIESYSGNVELQQARQAAALATVDVAVLEGELAVAENGAIWLNEDNYRPHRVLPFICQHLLIVLPLSVIVSNMHEAYERIDIRASGFGVFVAGPSKTADIEQSLVIGAQGARSLTILLEDR
jgi:L-lactate dehydrogenase complex protein LldG